MRRTHLWMVLVGLVACSSSPDPSPFGTGAVGSQGSEPTTDGSGTDGPASTSDIGDGTLIDPTVAGDDSSTSGLGGTSLVPVTDTTGDESSDGGGEETTGDPTTTGEGGPTGEECSAEEQQLISLINSRRAENGLGAIPTNPDLCAVAHAHTADLAENAPHASDQCTLRSWSNAGAWTSCCYTVVEEQFFEQLACMQSKPSEIVGYPAHGWEAVAVANDPASALAGFEAEGYSNGTLLNVGFFDAFAWQSIGASIHGGFAVVWVGTAP